MTVVVVVLLVVAGGFGAVARFVLDGVVLKRFAGAFPLGTVLINLTGSFTLGLLTGLALAQVLPDPVRLVAGTGFLGGYTTFSTASVETVRLLQQRRVAASLAYGPGVLVGFLLCCLGIWLGARRARPEAVS